MTGKLYFVTVLLAFSLAILGVLPVAAQSKKNDIPVQQVPKEVLETLEAYTKVLSVETIEKCAEAFVAIAGGSLVDETGSRLSTDVPQFSLKKDHANFKFYAVPLQITRVNRSISNGDGYGPSAIKGTVYKIWIGKKPGTPGMPAPISIMVPEGHPTIKTPKVIGIGSL